MMSWWALCQFPYGEGIDVLPELPAKEGYSAAWPDLDYRHITASQTVEAVYTPYTSALSGSGELPRILVDGSFGSRAKVAYAREEVCWTDQGGTQYSGTAWTVTVDDPDLKTVSIRFTTACRKREAGGVSGYRVKTVGSHRSILRRPLSAFVRQQRDKPHSVFCLESFLWFRSS